MELHPDPMPTVHSILGMPSEPEPIDHRAEAERILYRSVILDNFAEGNDPHGAALAHAALALADAAEHLVEEVRTSNLIAWEQVTGEKNRHTIRGRLGL